MRDIMQEPHRRRRAVNWICACCLGVFPPLTFAQTTVSVGAEYAVGKYGESRRSSTWTMPVVAKYESGPWVLKATVPYVRSSGTAAAGGDRFNLTKQTQEGWGDVVTTIAYDVVDHGTDGIVLGIGAKAKWATADRAKDLLTTGENDYSGFVDLLKPVGRTSFFATLGRTRKGDPEGIDYRNPWFSSIGASYKISDTIKVGVMHDFRQRLTAGGARVSEITVYFDRKFGGGYKLQLYVLRGLADASPDFAFGATIGVSF